MPRGQAAKPGDVTVAANGYQYTRTETKWRLTHHLIAEKKLGRPLANDERAFFKNGNRTDLRESNIAVAKKGSGKSPQARLAVVEAKLADLIAERDHIKEEIKRASRS